jgi:hypothetical protein
LVWEVVWGNGRAGVIFPNASRISINTPRVCEAKEQKATTDTRWRATFHPRGCREREKMFSRTTQTHAALRLHTQEAVFSFSPNSCGTSKIEKSSRARVARERARGTHSPGPAAQGNRLSYSHLSLFVAGREAGRKPY